MCSKRVAPRPGRRAQARVRRHVAVVGEVVAEHEQLGPRVVGRDGAAVVAVSVVVAVPPG